MADIFNQPKTDFVPIQDTATDADSPNSALTMEKIRDAIEMLIINMHGLFETGTLTSDPPNDTTGYAIDTGAGFSDDEHNNRRLIFTDGNAKGNDYLIDDTSASNNRVECTGDNLYSAGARSGDGYIIVGNFRDSGEGHTHDGENSSLAELPAFPIPFSMNENETALTDNNTSWTAIATGRVYIHPSMTTLHAELRFSRTPNGGGNQNQLRLYVGGQYSGTVGTTSSTYAYFTVSVDVSSLSGYQDISIQHRSIDTSPARTGILQGFIMMVDL